MEKRYHINDHNVVGVCTATVKPCRFSESEHYSTYQQAQERAEQKLENHYGVTTLSTTGSALVSAHHNLNTQNVDQLRDYIHTDMVADMSAEDREMVLRSAGRAEELHTGQWRKNKTENPDPYIIHPYRNAVRLHQWGVKDPDVLTATVLHDTIEDCANVITKMHGRNPEKTPNVEKRRVAYEWMTQEYNERVTTMVAHVTNPLRKKNLSVEEKRALYQSHVKDAVMQDHGTFAVKLSDFVDNAGNLHELASSSDKGRMSSQGMVKKYTPLIPVFDRGVDYHSEHFTEQQRKTMHDHLAFLSRSMKTVSMD